MINRHMVEGALLILGCFCWAVYFTVFTIYRFILMDVHGENHEIVKAYDREIYHPVFRFSIIYTLLLILCELVHLCGRFILHIW